MTGSGALRLSESAVDVALFIASWKEVLKGLGVRGKGAKKFCPGRELADFLVKLPAETSLTRNFLVKPLSSFS